MTKPYVPQPSTIPHRVVEHLKRQPPGTTIASAPLADELGITPSAIVPCMASAVHHGAVKRDRRNGIIYWSLGDGVPAPAPEDDDPDMKSKIVLTPAATAKKLDDQQAQALRNELEKRQQRAPVALVASPQITLNLPDPEPVFGAFSDGSMTIAHGDKFLRLGEKHAQALQSFMHKVWTSQ